jgi:hypothetical protein
MRVPKQMAKILFLCLSVRLFYSYCYQQGFRIFSICGNDKLFLVKNGEKLYFIWKSKKVCSLREWTYFINKPQSVLHKVQVEAEEPVEHQTQYNLDVQDFYIC